MGFKDMVFRNSHQFVLDILNKLQLAVGVIEKDAQQRLSTPEAKPTGDKITFPESVIRPVFFSDSIVLISNNNSRDSVLNLLASVEWVLQHAMQNSIPLKGAIAYGEQTADFARSLHFGKPLIDAYELQNELLLYGVVLHHTMEQYLTDAGIMEAFKGIRFFKYPTPLRAGIIDHYVVEWDEELLKDDVLEGMFSLLYGKVSGAPRLYVDNTKKFSEWLIEEKAKPKQLWPPVSGKKQRPTPKLHSKNSL